MSASVRFFLGFLTATLLWGAAFFLYGRGDLDFLLGSQAEEPVPDEVVEEAPTERASKKPRKKGMKRPRVGKASANGAAGAGDRTTGDDLGWDDSRQVDMGAGEQQLAGSAIDAGFDTVMGRIRRCLILVPTDGDITGKLLFGMRVSRDGKPKAINLSGPSIVTSGESGDCLRKAAQSIQFPSFDGPDMLFKYPITLE